jgi:hypothetical protein
MSVWQQKVVESFPDLREDVDEPGVTIYDVFYQLLGRVHEAHVRGDTEELRRIYSYAEWCFHQPEQDIWNAAGVAFYEHLVDEPVTLRGIPEWLCADVFLGVSGLFEARLPAAEYRRLCEEYQARNGVVFPQEMRRDDQRVEDWSV